MDQLRKESSPKSELKSQRDPGALECVLHGGAFLQLLEEVLGEQSVLITVLCCPFLAVLNSDHPFPLFLLPFPPFPMHFLDVSN